MYGSHITDYALAKCMTPITYCFPKELNSIYTFYIIAACYLSFLE
jgi:hypothetical protein